MTQRISQRFQEYQIQQTDASTPVKQLTGSWYHNYSENNIKCSQIGLMWKYKATMNTEA
jgi:nuclear transport factor 2 (NTF2) superfamily protein